MLGNMNCLLLEVVTFLLATQLLGWRRFAVHFDVCHPILFVLSVILLPLIRILSRFCHIELEGGMVVIILDAHG